MWTRFGSVQNGHLEVIDRDDIVDQLMLCQQGLACIFQLHTSNFIRSLFLLRGRRNPYRCSTTPLLSPYLSCSPPLSVLHCLASASNGVVDSGTLLGQTFRQRYAFPRTGTPPPPQTECLRSPAISIAGDMTEVSEFPRAKCVECPSLDRFEGAKRPAKWFIITTILADKNTFPGCGCPISSQLPWNRGLQVVVCGGSELYLARANEDEMWNSERRQYWWE